MVDENGQVFVQSSTQHPTETQEITAHVLGLPSNRVTVQCLRMGGGFGGKEMQPHGLAAVAALGATLTGRPVRLRLTRQQDMTMTGKRHGFHATWRVGFDDDGRFTALEATLTSDGGWSLDLSEPVLSRALCHIDNAYFIPDIRVQGRIARTNKTSQTAFRGFGGPQGMLVVEDIIGRCAPLLGIEPDLVRRRNFYVEGETTPYGQLVRHPERMVLAWDQVRDSSELVRRQREVATYNEEHPHTKRGLAITPVKFGISFNFTAFNQAGALVHVYKDGSVLINHGGTEMGQGLHTKMLQVAATALGLPLEKVRLAPTRTDKVPNTSATAASAGADLNGGAVKDACEQIIGRLTQVRADNPDASWDELVRIAYHQRIQLWAAGFYKTEGLSWDVTTMTGSPFKYFAYGAAVAEVEVDGFTGAYDLRRVDIVHDVGDSLSPLVDLGQVEGGFVQGAGWLTLEDLRWDTSDGPEPRPADDAVRVDLQAAELLGDADRVPRRAARARPRGRRRLRLEGRRRAAVDAGVQRPRGAARGVCGVRAGRRLGRARLAGHAGGGLLGARPGAFRSPGYDHLVAGGRGAPPDPRGRRPGHGDRRPRPRPARGRGEDGRRRSAYLGLGRRRQPRGRGRTPRAGAAGEPAARDPSRSRATSRTRPRSSTACSAAAARWPCCWSRCRSCRASRSSGSATSASSWPASWPATTSTCTSSTPDPSTWAPRRWPRSPTRSPPCTCTRCRCCPSWCSPSCRRAPTCW